MQVTLPEAGRISASFYNHGKLYLSDNGNAQIAWLKGKEKVRINGQDPEAKPPNRPNDLVVDVHGGVYYTLTRSGQVIYIHASGEQSAVSSSNAASADTAVRSTSMGWAVFTVSMIWKISAGS